MTNGLSSIFASPAVNFVLDQAPVWTTVPQSYSTAVNNFDSLRLYASGAYFDELSLNTQSVTLKAGTTVFVERKEVGFAPGFSGGYGAGPGLYEHSNFRGGRYQAGWSAAAGLGWYDNEVSSVMFSAETYAVQLFWYNHFRGPSITLYGSDGWIGDNGSVGGDDWNDDAMSYKAWGKRYENFYNSQYLWTSKWNNLYDQRIQLSYNLSTQAKDVYDYRPVYQTSTQMV